MDWSWASIDWETTWAGVQGVSAVAALWFVVIQVTRDSRARHRRDRAILVAARGTIEVYGKTLEAWVANSDLARVEIQSFAKLAGETRVFEMPAAELQLIPLHDLPDPDAVLAVLGARTKLAGTHELLKHASGTTPIAKDYFAAEAREMQKYADRLSASLARV